MPREMCTRCFQAQPLCFCASIRPMATATRFEILMHPKELKRVRLNTGRLSHLCLPNSEIRVGVGFDSDAGLQAMLRDPGSYPVLLYPGPGARDLSRGDLGAEELAGRRLVVLVLDATWSVSRTMLRLSPTLQALPRVMFTPSSPSRYVIKRQPRPHCLSTLEAIHELLLALERSGLDRYEDPGQLLSLFDRMQAHVLRCIADPDVANPRRRKKRKAEEGGEGGS